MQKIILLVTLILSLNISAETWLCTHPQLCVMADEYLKIIQKNDIELEVAIKTSGDPHHIEPNTKEIKAMSKVAMLLAAPTYLHPWSRAIVEMRQSKKELKTLEFSTDKNLFKKYPGASEEALAHFWLYPDIHCSYWQQLHLMLNKDQPMPACPYEFMGEKLKNAVTKIDRPIILSHDALVPLLRWLGIDAHAIRGSGHHEEPKPKQLKELHTLIQKHPSVIWVVESKISFPDSLKKMQRPSDVKLDLDTSGDFPNVGLTPLQRLELMFAKL